MKSREDILPDLYTINSVQEGQLKIRVPLSQQKGNKPIESHQAALRTSLSTVGVTLLDIQFQRDLVDELDEIKKVQLNTLGVWPSFKIDTPLGNLKMDLLELPDSNLFFLLARIHNCIVGYRRFRFVQGNNLFYVKGSIGVGLKGKGLAVPIELAFMKFLQLRANELKIKIIWEIENLNLPAFQEMRIKYENNKVSEKELQEAEKEQLRWQAMYGERGKLGISPIDENYGKKEFLPEKLDVMDGTEFPALKEIAEIKLQRLMQVPGNLVTSTIIEARRIKSENLRRAYVLKKLERDLRNILS